MGEEKLIDYRLYDPTKSLFGSKSNKAKFTTLHCSNSQNCFAYARGRCAVWHGMGGTRCPYSARRVEIGFTQRARKFRSWINERRDRVEGVKQLDSQDKIAEIGDYVFFPYPRWSIHMSGIDTKYQHGPFSSPSLFLPKEMFTVDLFERIMNARPHALMGGEILSYQRETVPQIAMHVQEEMPDFYAEWAEKYPETAKRFETPDYVGRKAYLKTVKPGSEFRSDRGLMVWDGERLTIDSYNSVLFPVSKLENVTVIMAPSDKTTIKITDNSQVTEDTRFES